MWKKIPVYIFVIGTLLGTMPLCGTDYTWQNGGTDVTNPANWGGGPPTDGDTGTFVNTGNLTPTLSGGDVFEIDELLFSNPAQAYTFNITGAGSTFNLVGTSSSAGVNNLSGDLQTFNVSNDAELVFQFNSIADGENQDPVLYNIGNSFSSGTLIFQDSSNGGGGAQVNALHGSNIIFNDNALAGALTYSVIEGSTMTFNQDSSGDRCIINLGIATPTPSGGFLNFFDNTNPGGGSTITALEGSIINFYDNSTAGLAVYTLSQSYLNFNDDSTSGLAGSLVFQIAAGAQPIVALEGSIITFNDQSYAGFSDFLLGDNTSHTSGTLNFLDSSNAYQCTATAIQGSTILFNDLATANFSVLTLGAGGVAPSSGNLVFTGSSSAGSSQINALEASTVVFNSEATAASSSIFLNDTAVLNFLDGSLAAAANITADTNAIVNFAQTNDQDFYGTLAGTGTVNKTGSNTLNILSNSSAFNGTTIIQNGNLALNNEWGGNIFVQSGGTISGNGTVGNHLAVAGIIAPGNSIGTLTINGNYNQQAGSIYQVQIDEQGESSLIDVLGTATLDKGSAVDVTTNGLSQLAPNQSFEANILEASGGVDGTYSTLTSNNPLITAFLTYGPNEVILHFQNTLALLPATHNERQVSTQLQGILNPASEESSVLLTLAQLPRCAAQASLDQMSAEQYTNLIPIAESTIRQFIRRLYDPLRNLTTRSCCGRYCGTNCTVWAESGYQRSFAAGSRNAKGFKASGYEISMGVHTSPNKCFTVGIGGSYESDNIHYDVGGSGKIDSGLGCLYALWRDAGCYIMGDLVFGYSRQNMRRPIHVGDLHFSKHSKPEIFQGVFYLEASKDYGCDGVLLQPFAGIELGFCQLNHVHEHGSDSFLNVHVSQKSKGSAYSSLGVHLTTANFAGFDLSMDVAWQYRLTAFDGGIAENFTTFGNQFIIDGTDYGRNSIEGAVNLSSRLGCGWEVFAKSYGQKWRRASTYTVLGGILFTW